MSGKSRVTKALSIVPPIRRLYEAVTTLQADALAIRSEQDRAAASGADHQLELKGYLSGALTSLQDRLERLSMQTEAGRQDMTERLAAVKAAIPDTPVVSVDEIDRATRREMGEAALRNLPLLPGGLEVKDDRIAIAGICGAPDNLTGNMAFFLNGDRIEDVDYPIRDPGLQARFPEVPGMWFQFRARIRENLARRGEESFWRLDASPTGVYVEDDWRRAIHFRNPATEAFPFPPISNIKRVIGDTSVERFAMGGAMIFKNAEHLLRQLGHTWGDFPQILDWGCGAGRLTRYLVSDTSSAVTGIDIDADNIAWCQATYTRARFEVVPLRPPTSLEGGRFNLVFGLSVLTHLQESDQFAWLAELHRLTIPGALLLLSVQGPTQYAYNGFPPKTYREIQDVGYLDLQRDNALDEVVSDKEYYRSAMQSRSYITERWGRFFEIVGFFDAIAGLQDFVVLRRSVDR